MSPIPLAVELTIACCLAAFFLHRYGDWRRQHVLVTGMTFIAWCFSLMIIFILPMDVSNTCYRQCLADHMENNQTSPAAPDNTTSSMTTTATVAISTGDMTTSVLLATGAADNVTNTTSGTVCKEPWSYVDPFVLNTLWNIIYWSSLLLTWLLLPLIQTYVTAGDFTVLGKLKASLIENAIFAGTYLLIFGICLVYVAVSPNLRLDGMQLKVLAATASNTWGLFLLVLLLGYGLVEVPRTCWASSRNAYMMQYLHFKLAKLSVEKSEAEEALEDALADTKRAAATIRPGDKLRKYVDIILQKCPESVRASASNATSAAAPAATARRSTRRSEEEEERGEGWTLGALAKVHKRVIDGTQTAQRTQVQWHMLIERALDLEDTLANESKGGVATFTRSFGRYEGPCQSCYSPVLEWYWKCRVRGYVLKVAAILLALVSAMVVWSECLFFITEPVLSLFAIFIDLASNHYNYFAIELISCATISFLCICTYFTIFRVRILNFYYLASHHQTNENTLIFAGMMLCRLTPPLCLNFLGLIHMDTHVTKKYGYEETSYTYIMGHMDVIPFIANGFNIYFPIAIVLLCVATYFNVAARCLHCIGFQQFMGDDDITTELVDDGREILNRERRRRQRAEDTATRKRNWQERFEASRARDDTSVTPSANNRRRGADLHDVFGGPSPSVSAGIAAVPTVATVTEGGARGRPTDADRIKVKDGPSSKGTTEGQRQAGATRSPTENDRAELLAEAEPIDYLTTSRYGNNNPFDDDEDEIVQGGSGVGRYQTSGGARQPRNDAGRGFFDDI